MPRPSPTRRPLVIGHRGAPGYRPEHTRSSYELAFAAGVDAVEPDVVFTKDRVAVVRHENEIGSTTDVADRAEFAARRTTKPVDGVPLTGWFTEDFTWEELATLRCRERLPLLRPDSAAHDGTEPILRLRDLFDLVEEASSRHDRDIAVVLEVKHAALFASMGFDVASLLHTELTDAGWAAGIHPLIVESFEPTVLAQLKARGIRAEFVFLLEADGKPYDLVLADGPAAPTYRSMLEPSALDALAAEVDGISVDKLLLVGPPGAAVPTLVGEAHARGLRVFTWTCRPENAFLEPEFRSGDDPAAHGDFAAEWRRIAELGVDGVFVDHPDLGMTAFR
ncbi:glycerophosphodiester phosphodiesterase family protein [Microbacterium sp. LjRoot45]|uniref:glycerophosphodiester phosphodiesterase family protein n=1 Tax=Microbacterium sp. LjRoot45 TaxID=3342329 RepID=UPI003ED157F6